MQLLFCGDVVGQSGRKAMYATVKRARRELGVDFVVATEKMRPEVMALLLIFARNSLTLVLM